MRGARVTKDVVFDLGNVLLRWDPRHLYRKVFADEARMERFLASACSLAWIHSIDGRRDFAAPIAARAQEFPEFAGELALFDTRWLETLDGAIEEASTVLGASNTRTFFLVTLPLLRPILIYVMITSMIGGIQMFDVPQILTNGKGTPNRMSMTLVMFLNNHLFGKNYGMGGAVSVILFLMAAVLSFFIFKINTRKERN